MKCPTCLEKLISVTLHGSANHVEGINHLVCNNFKCIGRQVFKHCPIDLFIQDNILIMYYIKMQHNQEWYDFRGHHNIGETDIRQGHLLVLKVDYIPIDLKNFHKATVKLFNRLMKLQVLQ